MKSITSNWALRVRCNTLKQAEAALADILTMIGVRVNEPQFNAFPASNLPGVSRRGNDGSGYDIAFEIPHVANDAGGALLEVILISRKLSSHWTIHFAPSGESRGCASNLPGAHSPSIEWTLSLN